MKQKKNVNRKKRVWAEAVGLNEYIHVSYVCVENESLWHYGEITGQKTECERTVCLFSIRSDDSGTHKFEAYDKILYTNRTLSLYTP